MTPPLDGYAEVPYLAGLLVTAIETGRIRWQNANGLFGVRPSLAELLAELDTHDRSVGPCEAIEAIADPTHHYYYHHLATCYRNFTNDPSNTNEFITQARESRGR